MAWKVARWDTGVPLVVRGQEAQLRSENSAGVSVGATMRWDVVVMWIVCVYVRVA